MQIAADGPAETASFICRQTSYFRSTSGFFMYYHKSKMVVVKNYVVKTEIFSPEEKQK